MSGAYRGIGVPQVQNIITKRLKSLQLGEMEERVSDLEEFSILADSRLDNLEGNGDMGLLAQRVSAVESKNTTQDTTLGTHTTEINSVKTRTTTLEGKMIVSIDNDSNQQNSINLLQTRATNIETLNTTQSGLITTANTKNSEQDGRLTALENTNVSTAGITEARIVELETQNAESIVQNQLRVGSIVGIESYLGTTRFSLGGLMMLHNYREHNYQRIHIAMTAVNMDGGVGLGVNRVAYIPLTTVDISGISTLYDSVQTWCKNNNEVTSTLPTANAVKAVTFSDRAGLSGIRYSYPTDGALANISTTALALERLAVQAGMGIAPIVITDGANFFNSGDGTYKIEGTAHFTFNSQGPQTGTIPRIRVYVMVVADYKYYNSTQNKFYTLDEQDGTTTLTITDQHRVFTQDIVLRDESSTTVTIPFSGIARTSQYVQDENMPGGLSIACFYSNIDNFNIGISLKSGVITGKGYPILTADAGRYVFQQPANLRYPL